MKRFTFFAIIMALVIGFASNAAALSDKKIEKYVVKESMAIMKNAGLTDVIKKTIKVQIIVHTQDGDRHWVTANTNFRSKKWGRYAIVVYIELLDNELTLKQYTSKGTAAIIDYNDVDDYKAAFVNYKMLAEDRGDFLKRVITQDDRDEANAQIDQLLSQS